MRTRLLPGRAYAFSALEQVFEEFGLPGAIRTDNGVPFASPNALFNLSKLSVWWLRLGIAIERIKPGNPQQNGRHKRMHLTLKLETTRPWACNLPPSSIGPRPAPIVACLISAIASTTKRSP